MPLLLDVSVRLALDVRVVVDDEEALCDPVGDELPDRLDDGDGIHAPPTSDDPTEQAVHAPVLLQDVHHVVALAAASQHVNPRQDENKQSESAEQPPKPGLPRQDPEDRDVPAAHKVHAPLVEAHALHQLVAAAALAQQ